MSELIIARFIHSQIAPCSQRFVDGRVVVAKRFSASFFKTFAEVSCGFPVYSIDMWESAYLKIVEALRIVNSR